MFIGEAPGYHEDQQGKPFVGRAGTILTKLLHHIDLERKDIYITNILKCRPPKNRNPHKEEVQACTPYLDAQIEIINPQILVPLGNFSYQYLFSIYDLPIDKISKDHGKVFSKQTIIGSVRLIPMYHPAVATYNPNKIDELMKDFEILKQHLTQMVRKNIG
jgi:DNA polymerase